MSETNRSLRIRTSINDTNPNLYVNLDQTYNTFEILSLKLSQEDVYKLHSANYGIIVGRVLANGNFGVPNAKISLFIEGDFENEEIASIYPYTSTASQDENGVRYNLLPDEKIDDCHQVVGTFPNKTYLLDNDVLIEVFDKYYKYTTRTNNSGDYIIGGVPVGNQTLHMDLDLSDCGILSQRPRDFVYKGYTIEQFENANQFKKDTNLESLSQIFSQDQVVNVIPFWGNENQGETIGITRADINISFRFEPTCVFMGSVVADNASNGISKKCIPTNQMGAMDELTTGEGTIEMIRYTPGGDIEEFQIKGTQLIDGNGVWCYQIPMNLDYMMTDEYGNMVPTDDPDKGIPTRTRARFRISMHDMEKNTDNYFRAKVLVPHNPQLKDNDTYEDYDYEFGSKTREDSFRDLLWNNVYTVKSYIPRFQKSKTLKKETERFTGIKHCNHYGNNNPMPYNNIRIRLPLMFMLLCALIKTYIRVVDFVNRMITAVGKVLGWLSRALFLDTKDRKRIGNRLKNIIYIVLADGLCPDLENWYFSPNSYGNYASNNQRDGIMNNDWAVEWNFLNQTWKSIKGETNELIRDEKDDYNYNNDIIIIDESSAIDETSIDKQNNGNKVYGNGKDIQHYCLTTEVDYLVSCIEMALAQEYRVINFDFYNDWINGVIYMPRWMRFVTPKRSFLFGLIKIKSKVRACMDDTSIFNQSRIYVQQCALTYEYDSSNDSYTKVKTPNGCKDKNSKKQKCHTYLGRQDYDIFGGRKNRSQKGNGGIVHENETMKGQYVYYLKPCEWGQETGKKVNLFANDIVLLGSLLDCNPYGIPQAYKYLTSSSYIMPTNLALTNMDDEGYLYNYGNSNTICSDYDVYDTRVRQADNNFKGTYNHYKDSEYNIQYGKTNGDNLTNVYDDTIPRTEAAGIAWNYTGPGQGVKSDNVSNSLYMPGGHFLGLSCINSETNVKSCINLERICEVGANMSQRREVVRKIDKDNNTFYYTYFAPTGFISNEDVNGGTFRNMFATMNQNRLLCTKKVDEQTGYPVYDFTYLRTNGFDGAIKSEIDKVNIYNEYWNTHIPLSDERSTFTDVAIDVEYDKVETSYTYTKTSEETKPDYYKFRLGITDNLTGSTKQQKKFLIVDTNKLQVKLPQYENSFYFYFGLRDGATAFDEFNKQFFSVCDSSNIIRKDLDINIIGTEEPNQCRFAQVVTFEITEANGIVSGYYEFIDDCNNTTTIPVNYQTENGSCQIRFELVFGKYTFNLTDENGANIVKTFEIGKDFVTANITSKMFEFRTSGLTENGILESAITLDCGYIYIDNFKYFSSDITWDNYIDNLVILDTDKKQRYGSKWNLLPSCITNGYTSNESLCRFSGSGINKIYVSHSDCNYDIYLVTLNNDNNCKGYTYLGNTYVEGIDNYDLYLGSKLLPYSKKLADRSGNWWLNISGETSDTIRNMEDWGARYALFKRLDESASTFTNKIIAMNGQGRILDTVLFGQPENENGLLQPDSRGTSVYYENDNFNSDYSLSDMSVIPTTLSSGDDIGNNRALFGEMAVNGNVIVSDKLEQKECHFYSGESSNYFVLNNPSSKLKNKHGCIVKLSDGTILYPVRVGDRFYFDGEMPSVVDEETSLATVSFYPIFYYPVMYRPFYVNFYVIQWTAHAYQEVISEDGETTYQVYDTSYSNSAISIKNGLTYNKKFKNVNINDDDKTNNVTVSNHDLSGLTPNYVYTDRNADRKVETNNLIQDAKKSMNSFSYSVTENGPEITASSTVAEKEAYSALTTPNEITLTTLNDSITSDDLPTMVYFYDDGSKKIFSGDTDDGKTAYYVVPKSQIPPNGKQYVRIGVDMYCFEFGEGTDSALGVERAGDIPINKPGEKVNVEFVNSTTVSFPYRKELDSEVTYAQRITGVSSSSLIDLESKLSEYYDMKPLKNQYWNRVGSPSDVINFIENLINNRITNAERIYFGDYTGTVTKDNLKDYCLIAFREKEDRVTENSTAKLIKIYTDIIEQKEYNGGELPILEITPFSADGIYNEDIIETMGRNSGSTFTAGGGSLTVQITSNVNWEFALCGNTGNWLNIRNEYGQNVQKIAGKNNATITIYANENSDVERTCYGYLNSPQYESDGHDSSWPQGNPDTFVIFKQYANHFYIEGESAYTSNITSAATNMTYNINTTYNISNISFSSDGSVEIISGTPSLTSKEFSVGFKKNEDTQSKSVIFTFKKGIKTVGTLQVIQAESEAYYFNLNETSITIPYTATSCECGIVTNYTQEMLNGITFEYSHDWLDGARIDASSNKFKIDVTPNTTDVENNSTIIFKDRDNIEIGRLTITQQAVVRVFKWKDTSSTAYTISNVSNAGETRSVDYTNNYTGLTCEYNNDVFENVTLSNISGDGTLTFICKENEGDERTEIITMKNGSDNLGYILRVRQNGVTRYLRFSGTTSTSRTETVEYNVNTIIVPIETNCESITTAITGDCITNVVTSTTSITITLSTNEGYTTRTGNVKLSAEGKSLQININQTANGYYKFDDSDSTAYTFSCSTKSSITRSFTASTNMSGTFSLDVIGSTPDWIGNASISSDGKKITITNISGWETENGGEIREAEYNVNCDGNNVGYLKIQQTAVEKFKPHLTVNGLTSGIIINSTDTTFTVKTTPNDSTVKYNIYVNGTIFHYDISGEKQYDYSCGENTTVNDKIFEVTIQKNNVILETVTVTQLAPPTRTIKIRGNNEIWGVTMYHLNPGSGYGNVNDSTINFEFSVTSGNGSIVGSVTGDTNGVLYNTNMTGEIEFRTTNTEEQNININLNISLDSTSVSASGYIHPVSEKNPYGFANNTYIYSGGIGKARNGVITIPNGEIGETTIINIEQTDWIIDKNS